jgi:hypothetical protein
MGVSKSPLVWFNDQFEFKLEEIKKAIRFKEWL